MMELNKIYNMDCLEGMKQMEDDSVDITITSPPYNLTKSIQHNSSVYEGEYEDRMSSNDYKKWICSVIDEMLRVTRKYVFFNFQVLSGNKEAYLDIIKDYRHYIKEFFIWAKTNPASPIHSNVCAYGFEFIICFSKYDNEKRSFKWCNFDQRKGDYVSNTMIKSTYKKHNPNHHAAFPFWLPEFFIKNFSKEGDIIMDPFMGTGTTAVAAYRNSRKYIGFEISGKFCGIIDERMSQKILSRWFE